jgi:glycosyltransferase involved in cell wall biosynthesis
MIEPSVAEAYEGICPVSEGTESVRILAANVDILVVWGTHNFASSWRGDPSKPFLLSVRHLPPEMDAGIYADVIDIDGFVAVSQSALLAIPDGVRSKSVIISNAIDPGRLVATRTRDEVRRSWNVSTSDFVIGYLGRLSVEKNPAAMIELARFADDGVKIVIVGAGGLMNDLVELAEGLDNVRLVGADHRAGDVLRAFDTLIVPSHFESYGLSLVEALSLGVPVISTNVGVAGEIPGLTRVVSEATGPKLWEAVQNDRSDVSGTASRIDSAKSWVGQNASLEVFGKRWSDHLAGLTLKPKTVKNPSKGCGCGSKSKSKQEAIRRALNKGLNK